MSGSNGKDKRFLANSLFPSTFHAALGMVLAETGAAQMHGSWGLRVFVGAPGLVLAGLALFRARLHWPTRDAGMSSPRTRAWIGYLALLAAGVSIGVLASAGRALLLGTVAALTYLLPWNRIPVCRDRFVVSSLVMLAGAVAWIVFRGRQDQSLYFMIAAWILYAPPVCMHVLILVALDRGYRIQETRVGGRTAGAVGAASGGVPGPAGARGQPAEDGTAAHHRRTLPERER